MIGRRGFLKGSAAMTGLGTPSPSRFPYPDRPDQGGVAPGAGGQIVRARRVIVSGPGGGIFIYSGRPALGNLIGSDTAASGTDQYGNAYLAGRVGYSVAGSIRTAIQIGAQPSTQGAITFYTATSPAGPWTFQGLIGCGINGNLTLEPGSVSGSVIIGSTIGTSQTLLFPPISTPPTGTLGTLIYNDGAGSGAISYLTNAGMGGRLDSSKTDINTIANANLSGPIRITAIWPIPANDMQVGTVYEIEMPWSCTMESQTLELGLNIDGVAAFAASDTIGGAIVAAGTGLNGTIKVSMKILTTGVTGTYNAWVSGVIRQNGVTNALFTNSATLAGSPALGAAIDTTIVHNLRINSMWGAGAAGQTISGFGSTFTRKGP